MTPDKLWNRNHQFNMKGTLQFILFFQLGNKRIFNHPKRSLFDSLILALATFCLTAVFRIRDNIIKSLLLCTVADKVEVDNLHAKSHARFLCFVLNL